MPFNNPKPLPPLSAEDIERFWSKVDKTPGQGSNGECWGWTAGADKNGYGKFSNYVPGERKQNHLRAVRVAHFIQHGYDAAPNCILHECDWPPCVRGDHLKVGTPTENAKDRDKKGRTSKGDQHSLRMQEVAAHGDRHGTHTHPESRLFGAKNPRYTHPETSPRGECHGMTKLTEKEVSEMRSLWNSGETTTKDLSIRFNVGRTHVYKIIRREVWRHI